MFYLCDIYKMIGDLQEMCSKLTTAVEVSMLPNIDNSKRMEAYNFVEQFKNDSPLQMFLDVSTYLTNTSNSGIVRHLGFQLLEYGIKHRWITMSPQEKLIVKDKCMVLIDKGTKSILEEDLFVKDGVSRLLVEIIKREWPQFWPGMIPEIIELSSHGDTQTELVLFMLLRLCEDIVVFQNVGSVMRRRDLYSSLTSNMEYLFVWLKKLLDANIMCLNNVQIKLNQAVLELIGCLCDWTNLNHVVGSNAGLFQCICQLLRQKEVCCVAANCLLQVVNRKGKIEDRRPIAVLFHPEMTLSLIEVTVALVNGPYTEASYQFLKLLSQVMCGLGCQLVFFCEKDVDITLPSNMDRFLECMMGISCHPSLVVSSYTNAFWMALFTSSAIDKLLPAVKVALPLWVDCAGVKVSRNGLPSREDHPACFYSRLDFDSDEDFLAQFQRARTEIMVNIKHLTQIDPTIPFTYIEKNLRELLAGDNATTGISAISPLVVRWDGLAHVMDATFGKLEQMDISGLVPPGIALIRDCLEYQGRDPLLLSTWLSCISYSFVFIQKIPQMVPLVLEKIFALVVFSYPGQTKDQRGRFVRNLRRHACSLLVKLASKYPDLLFPHFEVLYKTFCSLNLDPGELSQMERVTFLEALLILSNKLENYERQSSFVAEIIQPGMAEWSSMQPAFQSTSTFLSFVGLDRPPVEPSTDDTNGQNRSQISYCIHLLLGVIKRCSWPDNYEVAKAGGFIVGHLDGGTPLYQSPAAPHVIPHLTQLFYLLRSFNGLWEPSSLTKLSEGYSKAHCLLEVEKNNILGLPGTCVESLLDIPKSQTPLDRMQQFLTNVHDSCYHLLAACCSNLYYNFYPLQSLAPAICSSVFYGIEHIPDYRLRPMLRVFLRAFIFSCPKVAYQSVLLPVLSHVFPRVYARINEKWNHLSEICSAKGYEDESTANQEMLEDQLNRFLTRELLDLCKSLLIGGSSPDYNPEAMDFDGDLAPSDSSLHPITLSELGITVLHAPEVGSAVTLTVFRSLGWMDATASLKATTLASVLIKYLSTVGMLTFDEVRFLVHSVMTGLHHHGEHDANYNSLILLGIKLVECFYPAHPDLRVVFAQIAENKDFEVRKFFEMMNNPKSAKNDKTKKNLFKKMVDNVTGKNIGQCFKHNIVIRSLPPLSKPKPMNNDILCREKDIGLCNLFNS